MLTLASAELCFDKTVSGSSTQKRKPSRRRRTSMVVRANGKSAKQIPITISGAGSIARKGRRTSPRSIAGKNKREQRPCCSQRLQSDAVPAEGCSNSTIPHLIHSVLFVMLHVAAAACSAGNDKQRLCCSQRLRSDAAPVKGCPNSTIPHLIHSALFLMLHVAAAACSAGSRLGRRGASYTAGRPCHGWCRPF